MPVPSEVWVNNLSHEEHFICVAFSDHNHKWTIELQHRGEEGGRKHYANASGSCSGGSGLIDIQGSLVNNLRHKERCVRWEIQGIQIRRKLVSNKSVFLSLLPRLRVGSHLKCHSNPHVHQTCASFPFPSTHHSMCWKSWWRTLENTQHKKIGNGHIWFTVTGQSWVLLQFQTFYFRNEKCKKFGIPCWSFNPSDPTRPRWAVEGEKSKSWILEDLDVIHLNHLA